MCACSVTQSHLTLSSLTDSSVNGVFPERILEWLPFLLYGIFLTQGSCPGFLYLLHWQADSLTMSHLGIPNTLSIFSKFTSSSKGKIIEMYTEITEKAMATHSSTLTWKIPWTEEPGRLQSLGSLRVGHDWAASLSLFTFMHCRRKWQPTPVFLPGESQGRGSLVGCRLWGHTEWDTTEAT